MLRLGAELPATIEALSLADNEIAEINRKWRPLWPLADDKITGWGQNFERGLDGGGLFREGEKEPRRVGTAEEFEWAFNRTEKKRLKDVPALCAAYEAETKQIKEASGYVPARAWRGPPGPCKVCRRS